MVVTNEFEPDDADVEDVSAVEEHMCVEVVHVKHRENSEYCKIENYESVDLDSPSCEFLKPEGK